MYVGVTLPDLVDVRGLVVRRGGASVPPSSPVMSVFVLGFGLLDALGASDLNLGALGLIGACPPCCSTPRRSCCAASSTSCCSASDPTRSARDAGGRPDRRRPGARPAGDPRGARRSPTPRCVSTARPWRRSGHRGHPHPHALDLDGARPDRRRAAAGDLTLSPGDEHVLRLTAPLLAQTLRARALGRDLIESRGQTITAIEEERRRLRRDLHDGLGPRLSGVAFATDAARNLIGTDPDAADDLLGSCGPTRHGDRGDPAARLRDAAAGARRARPGAGPAPAGGGLRNRDGRAGRGHVTAPEDLADLSAAVEVAAYRIVVEALTNVARHSGSATGRGASSSVRTTGCGSRSRTAAPERRAGGPASACRRCASGPPSWAGPWRPDRTGGWAGRGAAAPLTSGAAGPGVPAGRERGRNSWNVVWIVIAVVVVLLWSACWWRCEQEEDRAAQGAGGGAPPGRPLPAPPSWTPTSRPVRPRSTPNARAWRRSVPGAGGGGRQARAAERAGTRTRSVRRTGSTRTSTTERRPTPSRRHPLPGGQRQRAAAARGAGHGTDAP